MSQITIISDGADGTAHYFARFLDEVGCNVHHYYWEAFTTSPAKSIEELLDDLCQGSGLYVREPPQFDFYDCALRDAIFANIPVAVSVIAPSRTTTNWSKPLHERSLASRLNHGYNPVRIPESVITTQISPSLPLNGMLIQKNISSIPGVPKRNLEGVTCSGVKNPLSGFIPALLQSELSGTEYRIHIVDDIALPFRLLRNDRQTAVDCPTPCPCEIASLPSSVLACCVHLTKSEGLRFSGVDVIETSSGDFWLLEVNPMPGYHAYESRLIKAGRPVSEALLYALLNSYSAA